MIAARYAQAVFDLARQDGTLDPLAREVEELSAAIAGSDDLRAVLASPVLSRDEQGRAVAAVVHRMGLGPTLTNTLALLAENRRLFALSGMLDALRELIAVERGEMTAEVISARALTQEQTERLTRTLSGKSGKTVKLNSRVDENLIGGMIVKLGSQMIDTSVASKLSSLQNTMKEVG